MILNFLKKNILKHIIVLWAYIHELKSASVKVKYKFSNDAGTFQRGREIKLLPRTMK